MKVEKLIEMLQTVVPPGDDVVFFVNDGPALILDFKGPKHDADWSFLEEEKQTMFCLYQKPNP